VSFCMMPKIRNGSACISVAEQAHTARLAWAQYSPLDLKTDDAGCAYRLVQMPRESAAPAGWQAVWQGARPRNKEEGFALLRRAD
ncbi:MAG TPA: glycosyltransferase family 39 protein, partial [Neisseria sp.]|nr:glycosyltransferase family 39 protein [Neisseria sp.]